MYAFVAGHHADDTESSADFSVSDRNRLISQDKSRQSLATV